MSGKNFFILLDGTSCKLATNTNISKFSKILGDENSEYFNGPCNFNRFKWMEIYYYANAKKDAVEAYNYVARYVKPNDKLFIIGYSRGAVNARILATLLTSEEERTKHFEVGDLPNQVNHDVEFLGLFDPVCGIVDYTEGIKEHTTVTNSRVKKYVEIIAADERFIPFRSNSLLKDFESYIVKNDSTTKLLPRNLSKNSLLQKFNFTEPLGLDSRKFILMPGCHADIGGQKGDVEIGSHALLSMFYEIAEHLDRDNKIVVADPSVIINAHHHADMASTAIVGQKSPFFKKVLAKKRKIQIGSKYAVWHNLINMLAGEKGVLKNRIYPWYRYRPDKQDADFPIYEPDYNLVNEAITLPNTL